MIGFYQARHPTHVNGVTSPAVAIPRFTPGRQLTAPASQSTCPSLIVDPSPKQLNCPIEGFVPFPFVLWTAAQHF